MVQNRPYCLSIAGFDPCGGAGTLADCKTFEQLGVHGLAVLTAHTFQNDITFEGVNWMPYNEIEKQLVPLANYPVQAVKIGLIEHADTLQRVIAWVKNNFPDSFIVWDPVLKASAGFTLHKPGVFPSDSLEGIDLITPNYPEYEALKLPEKQLAYLLKGGHRDTKKGIDTLYLQEEEIAIPGEPFAETIQKHGTGCVLSAAIAAEKAKGKSLPEACTLAKRYTEKFMLSNPTHLGFHA